MKSFFVLSALFALANALVEWPFSNPKSDYQGDTVETSIGSPGQNVKLQLTLYDSCQGLTIGSEAETTKGFDPTKSTTWHKTGSYNKGNGVSGTDDFVINDSNGKAQKLQQAAFNVDNKGLCKGESTFALTHDTEFRKNAFLGGLLKDVADKVVVLTFDKIPRMDDGFTGKVTIGGRPDICSNWHTVDETPIKVGPRWTFKLDKVAAGKFAASEPGISEINIDDPLFSLSSGTYNQITKELGVNKNRLMPCNTTKDIVFTINGFDLHIKPEEYMNEIDPNVNVCFFLAGTSDKNRFTLPAGVFSRYCLLLDIGNKQIGFGDKKQ